MNLKDGIILADKPIGFTSHDVVNLIRKRLRIKKVGHAGTLDPMATGLLVILLGSFTKRSLEFSNYDKEYDSELYLGVETDSGDAEGNIIAKKELNFDDNADEKIKDAIMSFSGETEQIPPMYSAKKVNGKPLYKLARKGVVLKREPIKILISKMEVKSIALPKVSFCVRCSKGTYIRQLAVDIGKKLGCGGHLSALRRTKIGSFSVDDAVSVLEIKKERDNLGFVYENILQPA